MFAYCNNNPVIYLDSEGEFALAISALVWLFVDLVISFGFIIQLIEIYEENSRSINALKNAHEEDSDSDESSQVEDAGVSAPATPPNGNRNNKNDTKYRGRSTYNKNGVRVDYEYYGNGSGNVHLHVKGQGKFYYSAASTTLYTQSGQLAAASIIKLLKDPEIQRAIEKALKYILE